MSYEASIKQRDERIAAASFMLNIENKIDHNDHQWK